MYLSLSLLFSPGAVVGPPDEPAVVGGVPPAPEPLDVEAVVHAAQHVLRGLDAACLPRQHGSVPRQHGSVPRQRCLTGGGSPAPRSGRSATARGT